MLMGLPVVDTIYNEVEVSTGYALQDVHYRIYTIMQVPHARGCVYHGV